MWTLFSKESPDTSSPDTSSPDTSSPDNSSLNNSSPGNSWPDDVSSNQSSNEPTIDESILESDSDLESESDLESASASESESSTGSTAIKSDISDAESSETPLGNMITTRLHPPPVPRKIILRDPGPSAIPDPQEVVSLILVSVISDGEFPQCYAVMGDPYRLQESSHVWNTAIVQDARTIPDELADLYTLIPGLSTYAPRRVRLGKRRRFEPLRLWTPSTRPRSVKNIYTFYIDCT